MRTSRAAWLLLASIALLLGCCVFSSCRTSRPTEEAPVTPASEVRLSDTTQTPLGQAKPAVSVSKPGMLSGIGRVFSTPEGIARRQQVKLARAQVPRTVKVKDGAFSWNGDATATAKKATAQVASPGATQTSIEKAKAPVAVGDGASATETTQKSAWPSPWWLLVLVVAALAYRFRKSIPFLG